MAETGANTLIEKGGGDQDARPVAITGMHRSGTSMVAKVLQLAGLHLGAEADLMPPAEQNPEGFFEHLGFVRLNDEVLNAAGAGWDCPPAGGFDWTQGSLEAFRDRARILAAPLQEHAPWGWKDPRTSLSLPFWRSALGPLRTIVVLRNPLEVVTSLHRRNGFSFALALTLWQIYAERILRDTAPEERLITHFDAYFLEPEKEIARVLSFVGIGHDQDPAMLRAAAVPALRHHRKSARDLEDHGFPPAAIALYRRLAREAEWWEGSAEAGDADVSSRRGAEIARGAGGVDLLRVENEALRRNNADFTAALAGREARIAELESALRTHEEARVELDGRIAERDGRLEDRRVLLLRSKHTIAALEEQLAALRQQAADLSERLAESERQRTVAELHEREQRTLLTALHAVQLQRDVEIMGTLGAVLSRHAPGAPASIYYRRLVEQVRRFVEMHVPAGASTLVATYGDDALLDLGDRQTRPFPASARGVAADYTDVSGGEAVAQLEAARGEGAHYLVVPSPAMPWLANHPELERHLDARYALVARERGIASVFALERQQGKISA